MSRKYWSEVFVGRCVKKSAILISFLKVQIESGHEGCGETTEGADSKLGSRREKLRQLRHSVADRSSITYLSYRVAAWHDDAALLPAHSPSEPLQ